MRPLIVTPEDAAALLAIAQSWERTPYIPDGAVKGSGCSCSMLPWSILTEFGAKIPRPPARGRMLRKDILPLMERWLTEHEGTHFQRVESGTEAAGDVMLYDAGIGHLTLCVGPGRVLHCWQTTGVHFANHQAENLSGKLRGVWRPIVAEFSAE